MIYMYIYVSHSENVIVSEQRTKFLRKIKKKDINVIDIYKGNKEEIECVSESMSEVMAKNNEKLDSLRTV